MIIDTSAYVGNWPFWPVHHMDSNGNGLVEIMDKYGIDKAVITSMDGILYDDEMGNDLVFAAAERHGGRLLPAVTVSPLIVKRNSAAYLEKMIERGAKALKLFPFYHSFFLSVTNKKLEQILKVAANYHLTVCIPIRLFMNWGLPAVSVSSIGELVKAYSEIHFLVENLNAGEFLPLVELAESLDNLYLGTAALTRYRGVHDMTERLGGNRVVAGMSAPLQYPNCGLLKVQKAELEEDDLLKVLGENAAMLFRV